jgi:hypothetical protein
VIRISRAAFAAMWDDPTVTTDEIAARFGLHRSSVTPYGRRLGLPKRKPGRKVILSDPKLFQEMWVAGVSSPDIAAHFGISKNYPVGIAQQMGLPKRKQGGHYAITIADFQAIKLREAMAASARAEQNAMAEAGMLHGYRDPGKTRRAA